MCFFICQGEADNVLGQQMVGTSDWPDFEGDASFTVPPKAMPELYALMAEQVSCSLFRVLLATACGEAVLVGLLWLVLWSAMSSRLYPPPLSR